MYDKHSALIINLIKLKGTAKLTVHGERVLVDFTQKHSRWRETNVILRLKEGYLPKFGLFPLKFKLS